MEWLLALGIASTVAGGAFALASGYNTAAATEASYNRAADTATREARASLAMATQEAENVKTAKEVARTNLAMLREQEGDVVRRAVWDRAQFDEAFRQNQEANRALVGASAISMIGTPMDILRTNAQKAERDRQQITENAMTQIAQLGLQGATLDETISGLNKQFSYWQDFRGDIGDPGQYGRDIRAEGAAIAKTQRETAWLNFGGSLASGAFKLGGMI
jgi:hypothetical protein